LEIWSVVVHVGAHLAAVVREMRDIIGFTTIITFSRYKPLGNWEDVATQGQSWSQLTDDFVMFCNISG